MLQVSPGSTAAAGDRPGVETYSCSAIAGAVYVLERGVA